MCFTQYTSKFGNLNSGHKAEKGQYSFKSQRKAMPKNVQTTTQLHSSHMLVNNAQNSPSQASQYVNHEIPDELFQILKDDAVKVLHSICQQIWKTQQWPQDWKRSVFIPIPKKGKAKECPNYHTIALISHASKVMLKTL